MNVFVFGFKSHSHFKYKHMKSIFVSAFDCCNQKRKQVNKLFFEFGLYLKFYIVLVRSLWFSAMQDIDDLEVNPLFRALQVIMLLYILCVH